MRRAAFVGLAVLLAACQGSIGSTPPVSAPQLGGANPNGQVQGVGGPGASRAKTSEATVKFTNNLAVLPFPVTEGYGLQIVLSTATPLPGASPSAAASSKAAASSLAAAVQAILGSSSPAASASAAPSVAPSAAAPTPSATPSPKGKKPTFPPVTVKLSVYPDLVAPAPTPDIDTDASPAPTPIADRPAILRGYFKSPVRFSVASLDAFRFTVPSDEIDPKRGFTIAVFAVPEKTQVAHALFGGAKDPSTRLAFTTNAVVDRDGTIHAGPGGTSLSFSAGQGYTAVLYADLRAVAGPGGAGSSSFGAPSPLQFSPSPGAAPPPGLPVPYGSTAIPAVTPTPGGIRSS